MGLDWLAGNKAKPGFESRFRELLTRAVAGEDFDHATLAEWNAIGTPAHETVGAPRVGIDEAATSWFLERLRNGRGKPGLMSRLFGLFQRSGTLTVEERKALQQAHGYYVLQLAPPCDGLPYYTNAPLNRELELTSFRGKFLELCQDVLGEELLTSAWERKLPEDLTAYGRTLMARAAEFGERHGCRVVCDQIVAPEEEEGPVFQTHVVASAARWCIYWGDRGHWLDVWF